MSWGHIHRKQRRRYERPNDARFLTFSCYHRLSLFQNDAIKDAFVTALAEARRRDGFRLCGYVVMPEHVHLMLVPNLPAGMPVSRLLGRLKADFFRKVLLRWRALEAPILSRIQDSHGEPHFWQAGGGYDRNIVASEEYCEKLAYMHENPCRRGLVTKAVDWRWFSAGWYMGLRGNGTLEMDVWDV